MKQMALLGRQSRVLVHGSTVIVRCLAMSATLHGPNREQQHRHISPAGTQRCSNFAIWEVACKPNGSRKEPTKLKFVEDDTRYSKMSHADVERLRRRSTENIRCRLRTVWKHASAFTMEKL